MYDDKMIGLSIAGFDPSGGAGILADIKTMASYGVHGTGAITALTAQNPKKVFSLKAVSTEYISEQIDSIFDEYNIKYAKTGLLYSKEIIQLVSKIVDKYSLKVVVDPVMVASVGASLGKEDIAKSLNKYLLKKSLIVTPNVQEAEKLANEKIENIDDAIEASYKIGKKCNVILTGGHLNGVNIFYNKNEDKHHLIKQDLIKTDNIHGTGCSFSAAIVANLVRFENNNNVNSNTNINNSSTDNCTNNSNNEIISEKDYLELAIKNSTKFIFESVKNGRYGTLNPNFNTKPYKL